LVALGDGLALALGLADCDADDVADAEGVADADAVAEPDGVTLDEVWPCVADPFGGPKIVLKSQPLAAQRIKNRSARPIKIGLVLSFLTTVVGGVVVMGPLPVDAAGAAVVVDDADAPGLVDAAVAAGLAGVAGATGGGVAADAAAALSASFWARFALILAAVR
jgi:hypothetical protein